MTAARDLLAVARDIVLRVEPGTGAGGAKWYADVLFPAVAKACGVLAQAGEVTAEEAVEFEIEQRAWLDRWYVTDPDVVRNRVALDLRAQSAWIEIGQKYGLNGEDVCIALDAVIARKPEAP